MTDAQQQEQHTALFFNLVMMLSTMAMQEMGKIVNPGTGKAEVQLEGAQAMIDMLEMRQARTAGNLNRSEERMLGETLRALQMNYVETSAMEAAKPAEQPAAPEPAAAPAEPVDEAVPGGADPAAPKGDAKEPKYHKKYGTE